MADPCGDSRSGRAPFDHDGRQAGSALITTMIVSSALLVVGTFAVMQARMDLLVHHHIRTAAEVFYVAEAGLEHALADLASDARFDRILGGPDGIEGTADDDSYPFRDGPPEFFPHPPFRYDVRVERVDENTAEIVSQGIGLGPAAGRVSAPVVRSTEPQLPAAASAFGLDLEMLLSDEFSLLGSEPGAPGEDVPALAVGDDESREKLLSELPETAKKRIVGPHGSPSVAGRRFVDLTELAARIARLPEALLLPDGAAGDLGSGVLVSRSSLLLSHASGSGLLLVQGTLVVEGQFDFSGLVLVMGDVSFAKSSTVHIGGGLLQGAPGSRMSLLGAGHIEYDLDAIRALDAEVPEILPRRALVAGWRERF